MHTKLGQAQTRLDSLSGLKSPTPAEKAEIARLTGDVYRFRAQAGLQARSDADKERTMRRAQEGKRILSARAKSSSQARALIEARLKVAIGLSPNDQLPGEHRQLVDDALKRHLSDPGYTDENMRVEMGQIASGIEATRKAKEGKSEAARKEAKSDALRAEDRQERQADRELRRTESQAKAAKADKKSAAGRVMSEWNAAQKGDGFTPRDPQWGELSKTDLRAALSSVGDDVAKSIFAYIDKWNAENKQPALTDEQKKALRAGR